MDEKQLLEEVILALKEAGYNPYEQLKGYLELNNETYITRKNNARSKIGLVSRNVIIDELNRKGYID